MLPNGKEKPISDLSASTSEIAVLVVGLTRDNIAALQRQYRTRLEVPSLEVDGRPFLGLEQVFVHLFCVSDPLFSKTMVVRTRDTVGQTSTVRLVEIDKGVVEDPAARCVADPAKNMRFDYTI